MKTSAIVLAAGQGKRMKSSLPKALHPLGGIPLICHILRTLQKLPLQKIYVVVGRDPRIRESLEKFSFKHRLEWVTQSVPRGTGDAVRCARTAVSSSEKHFLIVPADLPFLSPKTLIRLIKEHTEHQGELCLLTAHLEKPEGYGRILRNFNGDILGVREDISSEERDMLEVNVGIYIASKAFLFKALGQLRPSNKQKEYYLTDIVSLAPRKYGILVSSSEEVLGINSRETLAAAQQIYNRERTREWMNNGVTFLAPETNFVGADVRFDEDVVVYPNVFLDGKTRVGSGSVLGLGAQIVDSKIGKDCQIKSYSVIEDSVVEARAIIGPFARLRPLTIIGEGARIGNFVEIKKSTLRSKSKANHLAYIGDAVVGKGANIGAGVITCNYDGGRKYKGKAETIIGDGAFIGSDSQLVAPIKIGAGAYVASGSTITEDVPAKSLAIARGRQVTKKGYLKKR